MLRLSPYVESVGALMEALGTRDMLLGKLNQADKKDVRKLILEVVDKLC